MMLPMRVLRCHGYVFPASSTSWRSWIADIGLSGSDDRTIDMEVYLGASAKDESIRISATPWSWVASADDKEPPRLEDAAPLSRDQ